MKPMIKSAFDSMDEACSSILNNILHQRRLMIASNRGPITFETSETNNKVLFKRGSGGLVTALTGLARFADLSWFASAATSADRKWRSGNIVLDEGFLPLHMKFILPDENTYDLFYNQIANPLLWFLQHSMWDFVRAPTIDYETWRAWDKGYLTVNRMFAEAIMKEVQFNDKPALVMLQDYQLYLVSYYLRRKLGFKRPNVMTMFIHIPWPGPEDWGMLPSRMRGLILESLCDLDLIGLQTRDDGLNLLRTISSYLPNAHVNFRLGKVWYRNRTTHVRDFPISIDVGSLKELSESENVAEYRENLEQRWGQRQLIVRVDRMEPSKNIVRGFQAFEQLLELYPEHIGKVQFLALLVPSRYEVSEYQDYGDELMAAAGRVNVKYGDSEWEPIRVIIGSDYARAIAALQLYDVLLVNSLADGMNLVAKEGPIVNQKDGVLVLSERTGARQQLEIGAIVIPPIDVYSTAEALHQALTMPAEERRSRAMRLVQSIENEDIYNWLCRQLEQLVKLGL